MILAITAICLLVAAGYAASVWVLVRADTRWRESDGPRPWDNDAD